MESIPLSILEQHHGAAYLWAQEMQAPWVSLRNEQMELSNVISNECGPDCLLWSAARRDKEYLEQLQNTGPFFEVFYLKRLGSSLVILSVWRTRKVYNLVALYRTALKKLL